MSYKLWTPRVSECPVQILSWMKYCVDCWGLPTFGQILFRIWKISREDILKALEDKAFCLVFGILVKGRKRFLELPHITWHYPLHSCSQYSQLTQAVLWSSTHHRPVLFCPTLSHIVNSFPVVPSDHRSVLLSKEQVCQNLINVSPDATELTLQFLESGDAGSASTNDTTCPA